VPHAEAEIVELADRIVRAGYATRAEAISEIVAVLDPEDDSPDVEECATEAVDRAFVAQDHDERMWGTTDNDRLGRAAVSLEANGVLFRQNFACCQTCGFAQMAHQVERAAADGQRVRGFVFFHWNDTEQAIDGRGLSLSYAAVGSYPPDDYPDAAKAIAAELVEALQREGLASTWSGHLDQRVTVALRWQRRRFTAPPE
jgi:hypothetical protein